MDCDRSLELFKESGVVADKHRGRVAGLDRPTGGPSVIYLERGSCTHLTAKIDRLDREQMVWKGVQDSLETLGRHDIERCRSFARHTRFMECG